MTADDEPGSLTDAGRPVHGRCAGRTAIVTGSGGSMGGAIAMRLAEEGADVVLNDRKPELATRLEQPIRDLGRDTTSVVADVTTRAGASAIVDAALERFGVVDILVNVVGGVRGPIENRILDITEEQFDNTMNLCIKGTFHCTQLVLPSMIERRYGKIVNVASVSWTGEPMHPHYAAGKAAVVGFTRSVALDVAQHGINVNAISPGGVAGTMRNEQMAEATNPLRRWNSPDDIANAVIFLVSDESRNITGAALNVAGGDDPHV